MDPESMGTKMEYSPLNNMSSSGEEVEQFTLPTVPSHHDRPKRRRKRKEFDSMKPHHALMDTVRMTRSCSCSGCLTAFAIVILIAVVCGLSIVVYFMSNSVTDMQKLINNLQVAKESTSSNLISLQSKFDDSEKQILQLENTLSKNYSAKLDAQQRNIQALESNITALALKVNNILAAKSEKSSSATGKAGVQELVNLGSDVASLKSEIADLQQKQRSIDIRLTELDSSVQMLNADSSPHPTLPPGDLGETTRLSVLESRIRSVNDTCSSAVNAMKILLQNSSRDITRHTELVNGRVSDIDERVTELIDKDLQQVNSSIGLMEARLYYLEFNKTTSSAEGLKELVGRVDQLEAYIRDSQDVERRVTNGLERQVVNLTITSGIEDIISRVINKKTLELSQRLNELSNQVSQIKARVAVLEESAASADGTTTASDIDSSNTPAVHNTTTPADAEETTSIPRDSPTVPDTQSGNFLPSDLKGILGGNGKASTVITSPATANDGSTPQAHQDTTKKEHEH